MPILISENSQFQVELSNAGSKLVIVDFFASWCGPCRRIAPAFDELSRRFSNVVFLKVDVDKCPQTTARERVTAMPTFSFYRNKVKLDQMTGGDVQALVLKLIEHGGMDGDGAAASGFQGQVRQYLPTVAKWVGELRSLGFKIL